MTPLLQAKDVTKIYRTGGTVFNKSTLTALEGFNLTIESQAAPVLAVAGESGSGKSTLAQLLLGVIQPTHGHIHYKGKDLREMNAEERRSFRREVQAIFQDPFSVYNPFYKVDHVLETPLRKFGLAASKADMADRIETALRQVGLRSEETLGRYPHQLSGGQRQRVMIARALLLQPEIIIADEPVSMVDASLRANILESLLKLNQDMGITLIYITHDLTTAYQLCDKITIMYRGIVAESGSVDRVIKAPQHPYTQLLVSSIPQPNPDRQWGETEDASQDSSPRYEHGCRYAGRCSHVMPVCREKTPPLFQTGPNHVVSCYLYEDEAVSQTETAG